LAFRVARTVEEEIQITTEVLRWRKGDPIDSLFDEGTAGGWKAGYAMSERLDEIAKRGRG
jgi:hypothetical protein